MTEFKFLKIKSQTHKKIKILSADKERPMYKVIEEIIDDLILKTEMKNDNSA